MINRVNLALACERVCLYYRIWLWNQTALKCDVCVVFMCMLDMSWLLYYLLWSTTHISVYSHQLCFWQAAIYFSGQYFSHSSDCPILEEQLSRKVLYFDAVLSVLFWTIRKLRTGKLSNRGSMKVWRMWLISRTTASVVTLVCGGLGGTFLFSFERHCVPEDVLSFFFFSHAFH